MLNLLSLPCSLFHVENTVKSLVQLPHLFLLSDQSCASVFRSHGMACFLLLVTVNIKTIFKKRHYFSLEQFLAQSKIELNIQRFPTYLLPAHRYSLSHYQHPSSELHICYNL